jgi:serine/threonine-protein kinase
VGTVKKRIQGTPGYIAPEQAFRNEITPLTDVYNFGATLYWVLVRDEIPCALPSRNGKVGSAVNPDQIRMPRPVHEQDPRIPAGFNEIVMQCIRVHPEARFQSMEMVADRLDVLAEHCRSTGAGNALAGLQTSTGAPDRAYDSEPSKAG